jgi:DNA-binding transcriptional MerR regulator
MVANDVKKYYTIGEVAQLLSVSTSLIRFWEKKFPSLQPQKNKQGIRRYTQGDIAQLSKIYQLVKKQGYTLQGAKEAIKHSSKKLPVRGSAEIMNTLKDLREFLVHLKEIMIGTR